ncbi:MAG: DUF2884 family protein [Gammaproteobacteria bacterium]|jgi:hypothetical protein
MKKVLISTLASASLLSSAVMAHDDACSFSFDHDLSVINSNITISQTGTSKVFIDDNNQLFIDDQVQALTSEQQKLVDDYADNIRILIPEITSIAVEGINLGIDAASLAIGTLLGEGDPDYLEFVQRLQDLGDKIVAKIDSDNFDSRELERAFEDDFENEIEAFIDETMNELTPRLMAKVMTAALTDGGTSDFEMRAESMEADIEAMVEPRAEMLEQRAEELCTIITQLDTIENQLVESGLEKMDLIKANGDGSITFDSFDKFKDKKNFAIDLGN